MLVMEVDEIGASVRFTTVTINAKRPAQAAQAAGHDPWDTAAASAKQEDDEPPF